MLKGLLGRGGPPIAGAVMAMLLAACGSGPAAPTTRPAEPSATEAAHAGRPQPYQLYTHCGIDGIAATRELVGAVPEAKVLILTTFEQDDYVFGALRAGASGFLLKRTRPEDLIAAVHTIADGDCLLSPSVTRRVIDRMAQQPVPDLTGQGRLAGLTQREREVLSLIARGLSNREIAAALFIEESTIRTHVKRVLLKLGLRDRIQAVIFAYEADINKTPATSGEPRPRAAGP